MSQFFVLFVVFNRTPVEKVSLSPHQPHFCCCGKKMSPENKKKNPTFITDRNRMAENMAISHIDKYNLSFRISPDINVAPGLPKKKPEGEIINNKLGKEKKQSCRVMPDLCCLSFVYEPMVSRQTTPSSTPLIL